MNQYKLPVDPPDEVEQLSAALEVEWPNIARARASAREALDRLDHGLSNLVSRTSGFSFVVYGSLARREFTQGSDLDWTLLVDGPADPEHVESEISIRRRLRELGFKEPAPGGSFGGPDVQPRPGPQDRR
jgi:predicted nucleotidyltransferase